MKITKTVLALAAGAALLVASALPAAAVHPTSPVDHADVPNCTIFSKASDNCENVPLWSVSASVGFGASCHIHQIGTNPVTHDPIYHC